MAHTTQMKKAQIIQSIAKKGYPGINKLRACCYQPLMHRLAFAEGRSVLAVQAEWKLLPPQKFWPVVREIAEALGEPAVQTFDRLASMAPNPQACPPHPFLCPR